MSYGQERFEYSLDYYSGAQAAMFFEHFLIDEVTSLQWSVQQSKIPIYGYASQTFDEMAKGTIIVQGSFSINFVEAGYLWGVLDRIKNPRSSLPLRLEESISEWTQKSLADNDQSKTNNPYLIKSHTDAYLKLRDDSLEGDYPNSPRLQKSNFTNYINDYVWGPDSLEKEKPDHYSNMRRTDTKKLNGFDIYLSFRHDQSANQTVHKIEDVHLLGKAQTVVIDENPVQEVYSFYAKNVI